MQMSDYTDRSSQASAEGAQYVLHGGSSRAVRRRTHAAGLATHRDRAHCRRLGLALSICGAKLELTVGCCGAPPPQATPTSTCTSMRILWPTESSATAAARALYKG